jgi:uncharacterized protein (TIGR02647 family)
MEAEAPDNGAETIAAANRSASAHAEARMGPFRNAHNLERGPKMPYTPDLVQELNTLIRFNLETSQQGIKVHKTADPDVIAATRRLHAKGLLTQFDGGYLTGLGRDAAEHAQATLTILNSSASASNVLIRDLA